MKKYRPIIQMLRELKEDLEDNSMEIKHIKYARITGYIFGYITAWNYNNCEHITNNQIDLIYKYIDTLYDKYIMNK